MSAYQRFSHSKTHLTKKHKKEGAVSKSERTKFNTNNALFFLNLSVLCEFLVLFVVKN
jgi:hypothetical protein